MESCNILISATAAKYGGGKAILELFCEEKVNCDNFYIILSPHQPEVCPKNYRWIKKETNGFFSLIFNAFLLNLYYVYFDCIKTINFNNYNLIFPFKNRVTYFHNYLIIQSGDVKYKLIRGYLKIFQSKVKYVFQTQTVKDDFIRAFGFGLDGDVKWPGIKRISNIIYFSKQKNKILVPITNPLDKHKNIKLVYKLAEINPALSFYITSEKTELEGNCNNIHFIGMLEKCEFYRQISSSEAVLITSTFETVCLPVFESLYCGTPVIAYKAKYIEEIIDQEGIENINLFYNEKDFYDVFYNLSFEFISKNSNVFKGDWDI
jgi:glycosyltransferase involved in cell wall biosynthesis